MILHKKQKLKQIKTKIQVNRVVRNAEKMQVRMLVHEKRKAFTAELVPGFPVVPASMVILSAPESQWGDPEYGV